MRLPFFASVLFYCRFVRRHGSRGHTISRRRRRRLGHIRAPPSAYVTARNIGFRFCELGSDSARYSFPPKPAYVAAPTNVSEAAAGFLLERRRF